ncbi:MAG: bifunctional glutamate N-acetyltransferase/amino-acid acetyltransferase ArgJ [Pseudomonadales bacterium]
MASSDQVIRAVDGCRLAATAAGIKKPASDGSKRADLVLIEARAYSSIAATFTQNRFAAAPVLIAKRHMPVSNVEQPKYLLINSGNANAGTGAPGLASALSCCEMLAEDAGVDASSVLPFSTGVIGEPLDAGLIGTAIPELLATLEDTNWSAAAHGIMTTDTVAKLYSAEFELFGQRHSITGISKGAGMICPNMATMLCFIATDVSIDQALLAKLLAGAVEQSFNRITVDGDTSTNDACVVLATGDMNGARIESDSQAEFDAFGQQLNLACIDLARQIIADAEGASKLVTISVEQGASRADCLQVAYTIAHSPLVKTALFAADPNWGRLLAAIGRAPVEQLNVDRVSLYIGDVLVAERGAVAEGYCEQSAASIMQGAEYCIRVLLDSGDCADQVWTCDLSHEYVSINADYRS